ncbi:uncharacterized protein LOC126973801 isoform X3 [Leptidea sinapis]|uniref:uncharacterized protein LOC126973801 isoform X3 n=1 Tax=Leptidea sinapis TaxID=189913 RepID=UPI0021C42858|nr:uncharacterized protein LOC126973801 isoform X3 [Leptidea sinapis]
MITESNNYSCQEPPPCPGLLQSFEPAISQPIVEVPHDERVINIIRKTLSPNEKIIVCVSCWQYINIRPSTKMCNDHNLSQELPSYCDSQQTSDPVMSQPQVKVPHGLSGISDINIISNTLGPSSQIVVSFTCSQHKSTRFERKNFTRTSSFIGSGMGTKTNNYSSRKLPPYSSLKVQRGLSGGPVININSNTLQPSAQIIVKKNNSIRISCLIGSKMETPLSATSQPQVNLSHGLTKEPIINIISNTLGPNTKITVGCLCRKHFSTRVESKPSMGIVSCSLGSKMDDESNYDSFQKLKLTEKPFVNIKSNTMGPNAQIIVCDSSGIHIAQVEGKTSKSSYFFAIFSYIIRCWPCACYRNNTEQYVSN